MAGIVYLRTNRFEVKLEGITFRARDIESLCMNDFLFPQGKIWLRPPVVGFDVMHHPRDPNIVLLLLCFGLGCVILRLRSGDSLPESILNFLTDSRINFVGYGIPEKKDIFPFEELGWTRSKFDVGYLAAKVLNDPKYKKFELGELARKVLGIKRMVGLTEASSFERHEQIKCAICQLFISSAIAMTLLRQKDKSKVEDSPKKYSFLKNLNYLPLLNEGWFKPPKGKKDFTEAEGKARQENKMDDDIRVRINGKKCDEDKVSIRGILVLNSDDSGDDSSNAKAKEDIMEGNNFGSPKQGDNFCKEEDCLPKKVLKGILKCPTENSPCSLGAASPSLLCNEQRNGMTPKLRRANSKGFNVSFKADEF